MTDAEHERVHCEAMIAACSEWLLVIEHGIEYLDGRRNNITTLTDMAWILKEDRAHFARRLDKVNALVS